MNEGDFRKKLLMLIRLKRVTKQSLKSLKSTNPQSDREHSISWLSFSGVGNQQRLLQEHSVCKVLKAPGINSKQLKASRTSANVNVYESTIIRSLNNNVVHGSTARRKSLLSKKKIAASVQF